MLQKLPPFFMDPFLEVFEVVKVATKKCVEYICVKDDNREGFLPFVIAIACEISALWTPNVHWKCCECGLFCGSNARGGSRVVFWMYLYDRGIINAEYFLLSFSICEHSFCVKNFCGLPANVSFKNKPLTGTWRIWIKHIDTNIIRKDHTRRF